MSEERRRKPGQGSIKKYATAQGPRWYIVFGMVDPATGKRRQKLERGFTSEKAANAALQARLVDVSRKQYVEPTKQTVGEYLLDEWLPTLRVRPSTAASYRRNVEQHVVPHIGGRRLTDLEPNHLAALYRRLEREGRKDGREGGLSPRTIRYVHMILHRAFSAVVDVNNPRLARNPASKAANPPTAAEAEAPEMHTWDADELRAFLDWSAEKNDDLRIAWLLLAMTGMRRGELLALRWADVDLDGATVAVRRSLGVVKATGEQRVEEGPTKTGKSRVIDLDAETVAAMRTYRAGRASVGLQLVRDDGYVIAHPDGSRRHPERFSREFARRLDRCRRDLGEQGKPAPSPLRLHGLRHTHATLMLRTGIHPKIVSERLGHTKVSITLDIYSHAVPTLQREAASKLAALVYGSE